jgi:hypothetical protein
VTCTVGTIVVEVAEANHWLFAVDTILHRVA